MRIIFVVVVVHYYSSNMHIVSVILLATFSVILFCSYGDCVRSRKSTRMTLRQSANTRRRIHPEPSAAHVSKKIRMKKYFTDKISPYLDELENACIQHCIEEEEISGKRQEIPATQQQSTDSDDSNNKDKVNAEEIVDQFTVNAGKTDNTVELNVSGSEETLAVEAENVGNPSEEAVLQTKHEGRSSLNFQSTKSHEISRPILKIYFQSSKKRVQSVSHLR